MANDNKQTENNSTPVDYNKPIILEDYLDLEDFAKKCVNAVIYEKKEDCENPAIWNYIERQRELLDVKTEQGKDSSSDLNNEDVEKEEKTKNQIYSIITGKLVNIITEDLQKISGVDANSKNADEAFFLNFNGEKITDNDKKKLTKDLFGKLRTTGNIGWGTCEKSKLSIDGEGEVTYIIKSRFDGENDFNFTNYMLEKAMNLKELPKNDNVPNSIRSFIEILLTLLFLNQIKEANKAGLFRKYVNFEKNDAKIRGRIDINRHIKLNPLDNGRIAYSYREFTIVNDINRIILAAYDYAERRYKDVVREFLRKNRGVREGITRLKAEIPPVGRTELQNIIKRNKKKITHSVYKKWEAVRKTALRILKHMGISAADDPAHKTFGIFLEMSSGWECYLQKIMEEMSGNPPVTQSELEKLIKLKVLFNTVNAESKQNNHKNGNPYQRTFRPDFCFGLNLKEMEDGKETASFVIDAKYKRPWSSTEFDIINHSTGDDPIRLDLFQILAYMYRLQADVGAAAFPKPYNAQGEDKGEAKEYIEYIEKLNKVKKGSEDYKKLIENYLEKLKYKLDLRENPPVFYRLPIYIPQGVENDRDFKEKMRQSEEVFRSWVKAILKGEEKALKAEH